MRIFIDEAGRGPLAGPLYVGLVMEDQQWDFDQVDECFCDSKSLSAKKREVSYDLILELKKQGLQATTARSSAEEIDTRGVTRAINIAIIRGLYHLFSAQKGKKQSKNQTFDLVSKQVSERLSAQQVELWIDGKMDFGLGKELGVSVQTVIKGDAKVKGIAMASILAKVERDHTLIELAEEYPERDFAKHKGYGTKAHYAKIEQYGVSAEHRKLFLKERFPEHKIQPFDPFFTLWT